MSVMRARYEPQAGVKPGEQAQTEREAEGQERHDRRHLQVGDAEGAERARARHARQHGRGTTLREAEAEGAGDAGRSRRASTRISAITSPLGKPSVLSTAISVRRSRTAMLIVLAVTSRIVNATAEPDDVQQQREVAAERGEAGEKRLLALGLRLHVAVLERGVDGLGDRRRLRPDR